MIAARPCRGRGRRGGWTGSWKRVTAAGSTLWPSTGIPSTRRGQVGQGLKSIIIIMIIIIIIIIIIVGGLNRVFKDSASMSNAFFAGS
jgi:hypothetical protein